MVMKTLNSVLRGALLPFSTLYWSASTAHRLARSYRPRPLALPSVTVGGLTIGGEGKTPVASWVASYFSNLGRRPAILTRDYRGDEGLVHRVLCPGAMVVANADRVDGAYEARSRDADVVVMDDGFQRTDIRADLRVALVAAEHLDGPRWILPAGRWREGLGGLRRADHAIVTSKSASADRVSAAIELVGGCMGAEPGRIRFVIDGFTPLDGGDFVSSGDLAGSRVLGCAGIAEPGSFFRQLKGVGLVVKQLGLRDHFAFPERSVEHVTEQARGLDYVVVTLKDAVKLSGRWPGDAPPVLVARQGIRWDAGESRFSSELNRVAERAMEND